MRVITAILLLIVFAGCNKSEPTVELFVDPSKVSVGEDVTVQINQKDCESLTIILGNGTSYALSNPDGTESFPYAYAFPGDYTLQVVGYAYGLPPVTDHAFLTVE